MKRTLTCSLFILAIFASCTKVSPSEPTQKFTVDFTGQAPGISIVEFIGQDGQGNFYVAGSNDIKDVYIPLGHYSLRWTLKATVATSCTIQFYYTDGGSVSLPESGIHSLDIVGRLNQSMSFGSQCRRIVTQ